jgi:hypothetical protein
MDSPTIDALNATKTIHYLITPYKEWDAFKLGIIDKDGNQKKITTTPQEKTAFNLFHRMITKLRKYLERTPGYNKYLQAWNAGEHLTGVKIQPFAISHWSVANQSMRECMEEGLTDEFSLAARFDEKYEFMTESEIRLFEDGIGAMPSTNTGISPTTIPPDQGGTVVVKRKPAMLRRKNVAKPNTQ